MGAVAKTIKCLIINTIVVFVFCYFNINPAYADSIGFASGTLVSTPNGNIPIEQLHSGDRVIGYNFETHQEEIHHVKDIQQSSSLSYYLINNSSKFSGNNYIYIKAYKNPIVKKIHQLNKKDKLIRRNSRNYSLQQITQVVKPSKFYQISLESRKENVFVDDFLIYNGGTIPNKYNEKYKGIDCGIGSPYPNYRSWECTHQYLVFPQSLIAMVFLAVGLLFSIKAIDWFRENYVNCSK